MNRFIFSILGLLLLAPALPAKTNSEGPLLVVTKRSHPAKGQGEVTGQCLIFADRVMKTHKVDFLNVTHSEAISFAPNEVVRRIDGALHGKLKAIVGAKFTDPDRESDWEYEAVAEDPKEPGADKRFLLLSSEQGKQNDSPATSELVSFVSKLCQVNSL